MHISVPLLRLFHSMSGSQQIMAYVGTLQAPQIVVTDGCLNRLPSDECDAIVAHELAHIANGSLFIFVSVLPVAGALTTAIAFSLPLSVAAIFGYALVTGFYRFVSRPTGI